MQHWNVLSANTNNKKEREGQCLNKKEAGIICLLSVLGIKNGKNVTVMTSLRQNFFAEIAFWMPL